MELDVAIIGGGLSGNALARQLRRTVPELRVGVIERRTETSYRVGESTVELATNYLVRRLGLGTYLHEHHVPKNGLRFFFDTPERDAELPRMTEIGTRAFPFHPAFQIDRSRIDADLRRLNEEDGVEMLSGRACNLEIATDDGPHRFSCEQDGRAIQCRALAWEALYRRSDNCGSLSRSA